MEITISTLDKQALSTIVPLSNLQLDSELPWQLQTLF